MRYESTVKRATAYFFRSPLLLLHAPACCLVPCLPVLVCLLLLFWARATVCKPKAADSNGYVRVPLVQDITLSHLWPGRTPPEKILWRLPVCKYCYIHTPSPQNKVSALVLLRQKRSEKLCEVALPRPCVRHRVYTHAL
jgi:hypothetical protein